LIWALFLLVLAVGFLSYRDCWKNIMLFFLLVWQVNQKTALPTGERLCPLLRSPSSLVMYMGNAQRALVQLAGGSRGAECLLEVKPVHYP